MYISDLLKFLSKMFCSVKYSELCLGGISQKSQPPLPPPIPPKKSIGARPYGFKNLYPSKKPATVTQQLQKSVDFRWIELYDFHLGSGADLLLNVHKKHRHELRYARKARPGSLVDQCHLSEWYHRSKNTFSSSIIYWVLKYYSYRFKPSWPGSMCAIRYGPAINQTIEL